MNSPELRFSLACKVLEMAPPESEVTLVPGRKFRFDFAWPEHKIAVEINGMFGRDASGQRVNTSGHRSAKGRTRDMEKGNLARMQGYRVFEFSASEVNKHPIKCAEMIRDVIAAI